MTDWNINFRWVSEGAGDKPSLEKLRSQSSEFARLIVDNVAIAAADETYKRARTALRQDITRIVRNEVNRMARAIGRHLTVQERRSGPYGPMTMTSGEDTNFNTMSDQAKARGWSSTFRRQDTGIRWFKRDPKYLRRKKRNGQSGDWWSKKGELQRYLQGKRADWYFGAFGNMRVRFTKAFTESHSNVNLTRSSVKGRLSSTAQVGRLDVAFFGNITPATMPGLATGTPNSNPLPGLGVASMLPYNDQTVKLMARAQEYEQRYQTTEKRRLTYRKGYMNKFVWKRRRAGGSHRPAIDPFVSFYLTRAIPNAVWRRTENFVQRGIYTRGSSGKGFEFTGV